MAQRPTRSISVPIILSSVTVALSAALLVGWIWVISRNLSLTKETLQSTWLMVTGIISFAVIIAVLVLFTVFLAREIREVGRQTSFIDSVTHELRSPLASIRLCLETLDREGLSDHQREKLRVMMVDDVERLSAFIDDILQATRLGYGDALHTVSAVDLVDVVRRCVASVRKRHHVGDEEIHVDVEDELTLVTDPAALEIILKNLLDNAVKYSDAPQRVDIRARSTGDKTVTIDVIDRGVGIPKHALKRIFERFYRAPEEAVRSRRGTGLGLYVVSALVRNLGGKLQAHSEGPGMGTRVEIVLPRQAKGVTTTPEAVPERAFG